MCASAKVWTLEECLRYAEQNNITLQKAGLTRQSNYEEILASKAALLPSLTATSSQKGSVTPFRESSQTIINMSGSSTDGTATVGSSASKWAYNGSYGVNAKWTVWNGWRNHNTIKKNQLAEESSIADSIVSARSIEEKIMQYYIQILYTKENIKVQKSTLEFAKVNENRGKEMVRAGVMSRAECSQLTSTRAQDEYNVVKAESDCRNYKRQLKALLQITNQEEFDVISPSATDAMALKTIPSMTEVYELAHMNRPELKKAELAVKSAEVQEKIASAQHLPTISLEGSATASNNSNTSDMPKQLYTGFNIGAGVSVSVPLIDQRATKTAVNKARIQRQQALLDIRDKETTLYSTIEDYWIQAHNNQSQYKAAKISSQAAQESYNLLSEQFKVGIKNIVELQEGKAKLLSAKQSELQAKYMTILNIKMLEFYEKK